MGLIPTEITAEPDAIRATIGESRAAARSAASLLIDRRVRRIHLIGNGTSYHSAVAAALVHRRHARAREPTVIPSTAGEFRHYPPALGDDDAVVGISASGEFRDVVAVAETLRGRVPTIAVVHAPGSTLTGVVDHVVLSAGGPSAVPVMTKTFASTLTAALLLLAELFDDERSTMVVDGLLQAADAAEMAIVAASPLVADLATGLVGAEHVFVLGSGGGYPAALEAALKLKEMALVHAEGSESWEAASGAATLIGPVSTVIALAPAGRGRDAVLDVARHCVGWGARVLEVAPQASINGADLLPIAAMADEDYASLDTVPAVALLAHALARARGLDPDRPQWVERYRSQGLTHVVGAGEIT
jgi:glucosamine--fructose-6-phosphate aminotransferase (isomerizing)